MDPAWLLALDEQTRSVIVGAVGNLVGNLATDATKWLLGACARPIQNHFRQEPASQALETAMAQALAATLAWLTTDADEIAHLTTLFAAWLERDAVTAQR